MAIQDLRQISIAFFNISSRNEDVIHSDGAWVTCKQLLHSLLKYFTSRVYAKGHAKKSVTPEWCAESGKLGGVVFE